MKQNMIISFTIISCFDVPGRLEFCNIMQYLNEFLTILLFYNCLFFILRGFLSIFLQVSSGNWTVSFTSFCPRQNFTWCISLPHQFWVTSIHFLWGHPLPPYPSTGSLLSMKSASVTGSSILTTLKFHGILNLHKQTSQKASYRSHPNFVNIIFSANQFLPCNIKIFVWLVLLKSWIYMSFALQRSGNHSYLFSPTYITIDQK